MTEKIPLTFSSESASAEFGVQKAENLCSPPPDMESCRMCIGIQQNTKEMQTHTSHREPPAENHWAAIGRRLGGDWAAQVVDLGQDKIDDFPTLVSPSVIILYRVNSSITLKLKNQIFY